MLMKNISKQRVNIRTVTSEKCFPPGKTILNSCQFFAILVGEGIR